MIILPAMFHVNPLCVWTYPTIYLGIDPCVSGEPFSPKDFWPSSPVMASRRSRVCRPIYAYIYNAADPAAIEFDKLRLRMAFTGRRLCLWNSSTASKEKYGVEVVDGYGLTEATGSTSSSGVPPEHRLHRHGLSGLEVEIRTTEPDPALRRAGEICVKGDAVMLGYLNKPEATAESLKDGWLHTGDMGYMDEMGYVYISGRKKEMINRGGENIYPREIEIPLEKHPKIAEVAVVGAPDPALGERVRPASCCNEALYYDRRGGQGLSPGQAAKYKSGIY
jgi:long-chain acyl-CoA synthetase